jgi:hypothetical protein
MSLDPLDSGHVLRGDPHRIAHRLIQDSAPQLYNPVPNDNLSPYGTRPRLSFNLTGHAFLDLFVFRQGFFDFAA